MERIKSFEPIADKNSRVLILGSIPGVKSLQENQYYANPRNQFWKIIYDIYEEAFESEYLRRIEFLKKRKIALWDVIESCQRAGSSDSKIKNAIPNKFANMFKKYSSIKYVFFNGATPTEIFEKMVGSDFQNISFKRLLSTSPANAIKYSKKLKEWAVIKNVNK